MGNQAYREAFPDVQVVGHPRTREAMGTTAVANRAQYVKGLPGMLEYVRGQIAAGKDLEGEPLTSEVRASLSADVEVAERYLAQAAAFAPVLPTLLVTRELTLYRGERTIEIRHITRGNTAGDLVVWLPKERVVITGDLVVYPTPYVFDSYIGDWVTSLDSLKALDAAVLIPGHGPVLRDYRYVDMVSRALRAVQGQVGAAVARGLELDSIRKVVKLDSLRAEFVGNDRVSRFPWGYSFLGPAIARAYEEAKGTRGP
jgi:glyoxylase-like metal-dependent hydrolase (beta-lactamase superfamily II)